MPRPCCMPQAYRNSKRSIARGNGVPARIRIRLRQLATVTRTRPLSQTRDREVERDPPGLWGTGRLPPSTVKPMQERVAPVAREGIIQIAARVCGKQRPTLLKPLEEQAGEEPVTIRSGQS